MKTSDDLASTIITKANSAKHRQFRLLKNCQEYHNARKIRRCELLIISSIRKSTNKLFKEYCKEVTTGESDVFKLLAYRSAINVLKFYEEELRVISDMVDEYETYLAAGNWLDFVLGTQRPLDKLRDFRG